MWTGSISETHEDWHHHGKTHCRLEFSHIVLISINPNGGGCQYQQTLNSVILSASFLQGSSHLLHLKMKHFYKRHFLSELAVVNSLTSAYHFIIFSISWALMPYLSPHNCLCFNTPFMERHNSALKRNWHLRFRHPASVLFIFLTKSSLWTEHTVN